MNNINEDEDIDYTFLGSGSRYIPNCRIKTLNLETLQDIDHKFNLYLIEQLWTYYRLNDPFVIREYPNNSHLRNRLKIDAKQHYEEFQYLRYLFRMLIRLDRGELQFFLPREGKSYVIVKDGDSFTLVTLTIRQSQSEYQNDEIDIILTTCD